MIHTQSEMNVRLAKRVVLLAAQAVHTVAEAELYLPVGQARHVALAGAANPALCAESNKQHARTLVEDEAIILALTQVQDAAPTPLVLSEGQGRQPLDPVRALYVEAGQGEQFGGTPVWPVGLNNSSNMRTRNRMLLTHHMQRETSFVPALLMPPFGQSVHVLLPDAAP
jgi:hypothetical protein